LVSRKAERELFAIKKLAFVVFLYLNYLLALFTGLAPCSFIIIRPIFSMHQTECSSLCVRTLNSGDKLPASSRLADFMIFFPPFFSMPVCFFPASQTPRHPKKVPERSTSMPPAFL